MYVTQGVDTVSGHAFVRFLSHVEAFPTAKHILLVASIQICSFRLHVTINKRYAVTYLTTQSPVIFAPDRR